MKEKIIAVVIVIVVPLFLLAQGNEGIVFTKGESWQQILNRAKIENKHVFIDCFATWCGPCKKMDKEVYVEPLLGDFYNENFISVKVQIDSSKSDDRNVIAWYRDAQVIKTTYKIHSVPTYLFFSPKGELVNRDLGYKSVSDLISIGKNSLDTKKQLCALLNAWRMGMKDYNDILKLYNTYRQAKDLMLADSLAIDYKFYLNQVSENELLVKENLDFMASISKMITSKDRLFYLAYMQPLKIDSVTKQHWAADMVNSIIGKEEIRSDLEQVKNHPMEDSDWCRLRSLIKKKYPKIDANKIVLKEAISFYRKNKDWEKYTQYRTAYNDSYLNPDADAFLGLNGPAWDVFRHSSNRRALEQALDWSDFSIQLAKPGSNSLLQYLDTRANLLYKLGRIKEAVEQEERAISLSIELGMLTKSSAIKNSFYDEYVLNLNKMKNNIPTW